MSVNLTLSDRSQAVLSTIVNNDAGITQLEGPAFVSQAGIYHYVLPVNLLVNYPLTFTTPPFTLDASSAELFIVVISDPTLLSAIPNAPVADPANMPTAYYPSVGTAASFEIARKVVTSNGPVSFDLDLTLLTRFMSTYQSPTNRWNGHLIMWLCAVAAGGQLLDSPQPTLNAYGILDYTNRDTGRSGAPVGSRVARCPVTGLAISRQQMVRDGWRNIYVHPMAWDPVEPDNPDFQDYPDPNEDG